MTANHDTPEAVEAMAKIIGLEVMDDDGWPTHPSTREVVEAAAMLRRLHQRAVDAERGRDTAMQELAICQMACFDANTARADALREAAGVCRQRLISRSYGSHADAYEYAMNAILALIKQPTTTGET